jgi:hypothetical protein
VISASMPRLGSIVPSVARCVNDGSGASRSHKAYAGTNIAARPASAGEVGISAGGVTIVVDSSTPGPASVSEWQPTGSGSGTSTWSPMTSRSTVVPSASVSAAWPNPLWTGSGPPVPTTTPGVVRRTPAAASASSTSTTRRSDSGSAS